MNARSYLRILGVSLVSACAGLALAQRGDVTPLARVERVLPCARQHQQAIDRWMRLLGEAHEHLRSPTTSEGVRRDAAASIETLEQRLRTSAEALAACVGPSPATPASVPQTPPPAPDVQTSIGSAVRLGAVAMRGGPGRVGEGAVLNVVRELGPPLDACYDGLADRYAIVHGQAELVFRLSASGALSRVRIEGLNVGDAPFHRCVEGAVRRLRSPGAPVGGDVEVVVPLRFGPE